jgi:hypothetical protein
LARWDRESRPVLCATLRRAGFDPASADEAATHVLERAYWAIDAGRTIANELGWIGTVAARFRSAARRRALFDERIRCELERRGSATPVPEVDAADARREQLMVAARLLPPPYAQVVVLRGVHGMTEQRITAWLQRWRPIGAHQGRKIQRRAVVMLRAACRGADPRGIWPQRFSGKNAWIGAPLPRLATLVHVVDDSEVK